MATLMRDSDQHNNRLVTGVLACGSVFFLLAGLSTSASSALAQGMAAAPALTTPAAKASNSITSLKNSGALKIYSKPAWQDLTSLQQLSLKPLAANWNNLGEAQKRKWIAIAASYPSLAASEQAKLHSRMTEWVSLSQQQRDQARLNFARTKQISPTEKAATWQAYQALSPEEKKKLAVSAIPKPSGAAAAAKPVPTQKLAAVPVTRQTPKEASKLAAAGHDINRNTLLPRSQPAVEAPSTQKH
ncbi:MAG: DUF3106 domain-containing protein [Comamonadaceae bacterium]